MPEDAYETVTTEVAQGIDEIALIRLRVDRRWGRVRRTPVETVAVRRFPRRAYKDRDQWIGALGEAVAYAQRGELGCVVNVQPRSDGSLRILMVERTVAPDRVHTEVLAEHVLDASELGTTVDAASVTEELREWAQQRNDERRERFDQAAIETRSTDELAADRRRAAVELAAILDGGQA